MAVAAERPGVGTRTSPLSGKISIRAGKTGDQNALAALSAMVQELHVRERPDIFKPIDVVGLEEWFKEVLAAGSARIWLGQIADVTAGYVLVRDQSRPENAFCYERRWYEIDQMAVDPRHQRQGVAKALLARVIESAVAEDVQEIELNTWSFNTSAQMAFQKLGLASRSVRFGLSTGAGEEVAIQPGISAGRSTPRR